MAGKQMNLIFPVGGLNRRFAYQNQPPFTTPDCLNVRPDETLEGRARGGSRPGLRKVYAEQLGSAAPINMLGQVRAATTGLRVTWRDDFNGTEIDDTFWSLPSWWNDLPDVADGRAYHDLFPNNYRGALRTAISNLDVEQAYEITLGCFLSLASGYQSWGIVAQLDDDNPLLSQNSLEANVDLFTYVVGPTTYHRITMTLQQYTDGIFSTINSQIFDYIVGPLTWTKFVLIINGNSVSASFYHSGSESGYTISGTATAKDGTRLALPVYGNSDVDFFSLAYYPEARATLNQNFLVAASNGTLYVEEAGAMTAVVSDCTLNADLILQSAQYGGKLYIADYGVASSGSDGAVSLGGVLTATHETGDWTELCNQYDYRVVIMDSSSGTDDGTYAITSVAAGGVTLTGWSGNTVTCSYWVVRTLKVFDPTLQTLTEVVASAGTAPVGCSMIASCFGRIILAGDVLYPHLWYMSRRGDPEDWDYADTDVGAAIPGTNFSGGEIAAPITALVPQGDDFVVMGCVKSLWVLRGDPRSGGRIDAISRETGIVDKLAWCYGPSGEIYFLGRNGLNVLQPGAGGLPVPLSVDKIPQELVSINALTTNVLLAYDFAERGLHVFLSPDPSGTATHFWFDLQTASFWPFSLIENHQLHSAIEYDADSAEYSAVLLGCRDGYIRKFADDAPTDDGTEFESYVIYGPLLLGGITQEGLVTELDAALDKDSNAVDWQLFVGPTAEEALDAATSFANGEWSAGFNHKSRPRARGYAAYLKLLGQGSPWAIERVAAVVVAAGQQRMR